MLYLGSQEFPISIALKKRSPWKIWHTFSDKRNLGPSPWFSNDGWTVNELCSGLKYVKKVEN